MKLAMNRKNKGGKKGVGITITLVCNDVQENNLGRQDVPGKVDRVMSVETGKKLGEGVGVM
jgi:hypothetical protein